MFALAGWAGSAEGTLVPEAVHFCFQEMKEKNVPSAPSLPLGRGLLWALITPLQVAHAGPGGGLGLGCLIPHGNRAAGQELRHRGCPLGVLYGLQEGSLPGQGWRQGLVGAWQRVDT